MKKIHILSAAFMFVTFVSCKKEPVPVNQQSLDAGTSASVQLAADAKWQGVFLSYNGLPPTRVIPDKFFIKNGYARIYNDSIKIGRHNYYSTQFRLVIPTAINIKGDSVNFEIGVKNPLNSSWFDASHGRNVNIYIKGQTNDALITNTSTDDVSPGSQEYALMRIGGTVMNNVAELQYNFEDYGTLILQTFNRGLVAYRNNAYVKGLSYGGEPLIGRLKEIGVIFKGSGFIDYVKLYNSATGKLLMSEDFNTDGQSTVVWY
jgi:hypothetical protein